MKKKYKRKFEVADLVLAYGDLAEVLEIRESQFGYTSYKIRYLRKPPLPDLPEDWLPSEDIVRLVRKANIRDFWDKNLKNLPHREEAKLLLDQSDERLYEVTKKTFIDLDERGVLIPMLSGGSKQREKID
jgi:hypothetical protein